MAYVYGDCPYSKDWGSECAVTKEKPPYKTYCRGDNDWRSCPIFRTAQQYLDSRGKRY